LECLSAIYGPNQCESSDSGKVSRRSVTLAKVPEGWADGRVLWKAHMTCFFGEEGRRTDVDQRLCIVVDNIVKAVVNMLVNRV
jgi:hypothetical protein